MSTAVQFADCWWMCVPCDVVAMKEVYLSTRGWVWLFTILRFELNLKWTKYLQRRTEIPGQALLPTYDLTDARETRS